MSARSTDRPNPLPWPPAWVGLLFLLVAALLALPYAHAADGPAASAAGRKQLAERDRWAEEMRHHRARGDLGQAVAAAEKKLALERTLFGEKHEDVVGTLQLLADLHTAREDFPAARRAREEVLALRVKRLEGKYSGDRRWQVTDARLALASTQRLGTLSRDQRAQLAEAAPFLEQANKLGYREPEKQPEPVLMVMGPDRTIYRPARPVAVPGPQVRAAIRAGCKALEIRKALLGTDDVAYALGLCLLADLYNTKGDDDRAEPLYQQALAILKKVGAEVHPASAHVLLTLSTFYAAQGDQSRADGLRERAEGIHSAMTGRWTLTSTQALEKVQVMRQRVVEANPSDRIARLRKLAKLYAEAGDYARAEPLCREVVEVCQRSRGEKHPDYAASLSDLAALYADMGDYARAEPLCHQVRDLRRQVLGEKHLDYAASLHNLAALYARMGNYAQAEPLLRQALDIVKGTAGVNHPDYAHGLCTLALVCKRRGDSAAAEPLYWNALRLLTAQGGQEQPLFAQALHNLGCLYRDQGEYARAEPLLLRAQELRQKMLKEDHPDLADSLHDLAVLYTATGNYARAEPLLLQVLRQTRQGLERAAVVQSERQQLAMTQSLRDYLDLYLTLAVRARLPGERVYQEVLVWKGLVFTRRQHVLAELTRGQGPASRGGKGRVGELAGLLHDLQKTAGSLAALALENPPEAEADSARWKRDLEELTQKKERLEAERARRLAALQKTSAPPLTAARIQAGLPADGALVDFLEYKPPALGPRGPASGPAEARLAAFILRPGQPVVQLDLGPVAPIAAVLARWRTTFQPGPSGPSVPAAAVELRRLLWQPLESSLRDVKMVLVSPDGVLARCPFAALPGKDSGRYLLEELTVGVCPEPRLLPELRAGPEGVAAAEPSLLLVGDVSFGDVSKEPKAAASREAVRRFSPLPATRGEVLSVRDTFEQIYPDGRVQLLRAARATKDAFQQLAPNSRWVHLATHGFFAEGLPVTLAAAPASRGDFLSRQDMMAYHPALLSGLALAGANRPSASAHGDGLLTALEVAEMDLHAVDLAVLSACETGLGKVVEGEGVLGLQRAFQVAGARSVVASLWQVPDDATRRLMERFYENLWQRNKGQRKLEALREAQLWLLANQRRGLVREPPPAEAAEKARVAPYSWAGFVLSGDWR